MKNLKSKTGVLIICIIAAVVSLLGIGTTISYLHAHDTKTNTFKPGENKTEITENWHKPKILTQKNVYLKTISVQNDSKVPCYVRVYIGFNNADALKYSYFSNATMTEEKEQEYKEKIAIYESSEDENAEFPDYTEYISDDSFKAANPNSENSYAKVYCNVKTADWYYNSVDGYYYYTRKVDADGITATPLFRWVKTDFSGEVPIKEHEIYVYSETIQAYDKDGKEFTDTKGNYAWEKAWGLFETP